MSLPPLIRLGMSSWTYPGWQGQIYQQQYAKTAFVRECLREYGQYLYNGDPLFRTVGNDSTFYRPPTASNFVTTWNKFLKTSRCASRSGKKSPSPPLRSRPVMASRREKPNPRFLDFKLFTELFLTPFREVQFKPHIGPFIFEFQQHSIAHHKFCAHLD